MAANRVTGMTGCKETPTTINSPPWTVGTPTAFDPDKGTDREDGYGAIGHRVRYNYITSMKEYEHKSFEELRCGDYLMNRKGKGAKVTTPITAFNFNTTNNQPFGLISNNLFANPNSNSLFGTKNNSLFPSLNTNTTGFNFGKNTTSPFGTPQNQFSFGNTTQPQTFFNNTNTGSIFPQTTTPAFTFSNPTSPFQSTNNPFQFPALQQQQQPQQQFPPFQAQPQFPTPFGQPQVQPNPFWSPNPTNFNGFQPQFTPFGQQIAQPNQFNPWNPYQQPQGYNYAQTYPIQRPPVSSSTSTFLIPGTYNTPPQVLSCTPYPELPPMDCDPATFARHMKAAAAKLRPDQPTGTFPKTSSVRSYAYGEEHKNQLPLSLMVPKKKPPPKVDGRIFTHGRLSFGNYSDRSDNYDKDISKDKVGPEDTYMFKPTPWKTLDPMAPGFKDLYTADRNSNRRSTLSGRDRYFRNNGNLLAEFTWNEDNSPGRATCVHGQDRLSGLDSNEVEPEEDDELFEGPVGVRIRSGPEIKTQDSKCKQKSGVKLTRHDYYCKPTLTELDNMTDENGNCFVENFTVGHSTWGKATFEGIMNVANLDLDELIEFSYKEFTIYPTAERLPTPGVGLNRCCVVTLERVWPWNAGANEKMKNVERLKKIGFDKCLQRACERFHGEFIDYNPETGTWIFKLQSFPDLVMN